MTYAFIEATALEQAQSEFSDFYKEIHGIRPRWVQCDTVEGYEAEIKKLQDGIEAQKATFAGREELRADGWIIPETEPELIKQARWLAEERARGW